MPQVHAAVTRSADDRACASCLKVTVSKNWLAADVMPIALRPAAKRAASPCTRLAMSQAFRAVIHGIHVGHDREQHLRRADVAGRLLHPGECAAHGFAGSGDRLGFALSVNGHTDQTARHVALVGIAHRHECSEGPPYNPSARQRCDEPITMSAPTRRGLQQHQRKRIGGADEQRPLCRARCFRVRCHIVNLTAGGGVLRQDGEVVVCSISCGAKPTLTSMPSGSACCFSTSMVCGWQSFTTMMMLLVDFACRLASVIASAVAVPSSSNDELAMSMPVRLQIIV